MLHPVTNSLGQRAGAFARDRFTPLGSARMVFAAWLALAGCAAALASEPPPSPEELVRSTAVAVGADDGSGKAGDLDEWARSVIDDALERSGADARNTAASGIASLAAPEDDGEATAPLPAEPHAGRIAEGLAALGGLLVRQGSPARQGAEVLVFLSLAVPEASWAQWAAEAARAGAPLLLRGVSREGLRATAAEVRRRLAGHEAGVAVDPRLFTLFRVERVPAVAVVPGGVPPCETRSCADDAPPPFDAVRGNIGLSAALEAVAADGEASREAARRHLERLRSQP